MHQGRQTVMLVVHGGYPARYLLRTDIYRTLQRAGVCIVILTPNAGEEYFAREFAAPNVFIERYRLDECSAYRDGSRLQRVLAVIRNATLNGRGDLATLDYNFAVAAEEGAGRGPVKRARLAAVAALIKLARRSRLVRRAIVELESRLFVGDFHRAVFEKYRPELIVTTSLGYFDFDQFVMREARRARAKVLTVVLSWDNPTSWGLGGATAHHVIAWTEEMKNELFTYHDIPPERISVGGVAHFDTYFRPLKLSREALFALWGLDPGRRLILLGSRAPTRFPWNEIIIEMIGRAIEDGRLATDCQLLVRLHPIHFRERDGRRIYAHVLENYEQLKARFRHVHFDHPAILSSRLPLDMPGDDMDKLAALLQYSSVMVTMLSTLNIEAAAFDLPTINVCFGQYGRSRTVSLRENEPVVGQSFTHIKRLIRYGASALVYNEQDLIAALNRYLDHPEYEREARGRLAAAECGPHRGSAGRVIGDAVLRLLDGQTAGWRGASEPADLVHVVGGRA